MLESRALSAIDEDIGNDIVNGSAALRSFAPLHIPAESNRRQLLLDAKLHNAHYSGLQVCKTNMSSS